MSDLLPYIILGLTSGAVYGLAGVGLVLTYKTSGILNFAHGALAAVSAFTFYALNVERGVSWPIAAGVCVLVVGPVMGLIFERIAAKVAGAGLAMQVTSTVGVTLIITAGSLLVYPNQTGMFVPNFLSQEVVEVGAATVPWSGIETALFALFSTAALYAFLRFSRYGKAMRAVVDSPDLLDLSGTNPVAVRRLAWIIGVSFASASGVLFAPLLPLDATNLTFLIVAAFGAAAIGAFTSLPLTFTGGLIVGVLGSLIPKWFTSGALIGLGPSLPFLILFVLLLVLPRRYLVERSARREVRPRDTWTAPMQVRGPIAFIFVVFLILVPTFAGFHLADWTLALASAVVLLSLGLLVRTSGQVSLCVMGFAAIGACTFSHLAVGQGWPWLLAMLAAGLVAVPVSAVLAIPAMRLSGLYLALATLGFGVLLSYLFYPAEYMFGSSGVGLPEPSTDFGVLNFSPATNLYYVMLIMLTIVAIGVIALNRSRLGRLLRAMSDSPTALMTSGVSLNVTRTLVFCMSGFLAAIGGALMGVASGVASSTTFAPIVSLTFVVLIVISLGNEPWNAIGAALGLVVLPSYITGTTTTYWMQLLFGVGAVLFAVGPPPRIPLPVRRALDRRFRQPIGNAAPIAEAPQMPRAVSGRRLGTESPTTSLEVRDVSVRFGGLVALDGLTLSAPTGRVTGLIGPNGAGKTTTFNACTGLVRPSSGAVALEGQEITTWSPAARARLGLARTFQQTQLFDSLTVRENVAMGREAGMAGATPLRQVFTSRSERRLVQKAADDALALCGLTVLADSPVASLSTGQRRLIELARVLASPARVLLLDEPSAGLDKAETLRFGEILKRVMAERDVALLLVEHDMSLVMDVCDYIYVLDFGRLLFEGTPGEVRTSAVVQAAYLGSDEVEDVLAPTVRAEA